MRWCEEDPVAVDRIQSVVDNRVGDNSKTPSCKGAGDAEEHEENACPSPENTNVQSTVQKTTSTPSYDSDFNRFSRTPPLATSASLQQVTTTEHHQQEVVQRKRKHTAESVTHEEEDRQEEIKLIKRSNGE